MREGRFKCLSWRRSNSRTEELEDTMARSISYQYRHVCVLFKGGEAEKIWRNEKRFLILALISDFNELCCDLFQIVGPQRELKYFLAPVEPHLDVRGYQCHRVSRFIVELQSKVVSTMRVIIKIESDLGPGLLNHHPSVNHSDSRTATLDSTGFGSTLASNKIGWNKLEGSNM